MLVFSSCQRWHCDETITNFHDELLERFLQIESGRSRTEKPQNSDGSRLLHHNVILEAAFYLPVGSFQRSVARYQTLRLLPMSKINIEDESCKIDRLPC